MLATALLIILVASIPAVAAFLPPGKTSNPQGIRANWINNINLKNSENGNPKPKKQRMSSKGYRPSREESVNFDPTKLGLPSNWALTSFSTLKG